MLEKFPLDTGNMWEGDLETKLSMIPCAEMQVGYYADLVKKGGWIQSEESEREDKIAKELLAAGLTNLESFVNLGSKLAISSESTLAIDYDHYLTNYTNEIFNFICDSNIGIDDLYEDYKELAKYAQTNSTVRFGFNTLNNVMREFIEVNSKETTHIGIDTAGLNNDLLYAKYKARVAFYKVPNFIAKNIVDKNNSHPVIDATGVYIAVKRDSELYKRLKDTLDPYFVNRMLRIYMHPYNSVQSLRSVTIYKTFREDYKIRLV